MPRARPARFTRRCRRGGGQLFGRWAWEEAVGGCFIRTLGLQEAPGASGPRLAPGVRNTGTISLGECASGGNGHPNAWVVFLGDATKAGCWLWQLDGRGGSMRSGLIAGRISQVPVAGLPQLAGCMCSRADGTRQVHMNDNGSWSPHSVIAHVSTWFTADGGVRRGGAPRCAAAVRAPRTHSSSSIRAFRLECAW